MWLSRQRARGMRVLTARLIDSIRGDPSFKVISHAQCISLSGHNVKSVWTLYRKSLRKWWTQRIECPQRWDGRPTALCEYECLLVHMQVVKIVFWELSYRDSASLSLYWVLQAENAWRTVVQMYIMILWHHSGCHSFSGWMCGVCPYGCII